MSRPSDWRQRDQGRDLDHSYIVQAPAGSGKTELLTQRMLGLLARVENPEEVVAITFTRKAAAEMSHRLVTRLHEAGRQVLGTNTAEELQAHEQISRDLALAVLEQDARQGWNLLEQPSRLRIRTIDSLCSELARQLPVLSSLGGGQQIATDPAALYRTAATRTMASIEDDADPLQADVIRVLDRYDNQYDRLVELLTSMLGNREQWIQHLLDTRSGDGFDRDGMQQALQYLVQNQLENARHNTPDHLFASLPVLFDFALQHGPEDGQALQEMMQACCAAKNGYLDLPVTADSLVHWQTMIQRLLTKDGKKWRGTPTASAGFPAPSNAKGENKALFKSMKDQFRALTDTYADDDRLREIYNTINTLPKPYYDDEAWASLESLMRILLRAAENWKLVIAETGEMDYSEVAYRAIESLGHEDAPSELALRMDYRIQHLLVDEFQDTSASQVRLLNQLTAGWSDGDGRTLFLVGDPMQSIYRFRKAEVNLFISAWRGDLFEQIRLKPISLSVNFRSNRPVVEWVNRIFPAVLPGDNDTVMGAVSYSAAGTKPGVSASGEVRLDILPERDDYEEALRVVDVIRQSGPKETTAILVRSRSHASAILAELDRLKNTDDRFRYQALKLTPLAQTPLIRDLVSLTLAILQPADRLAWLASLRAPFVGLSLADLDALVIGDAGQLIPDTIGALLDGSHPAGLSVEGRSILSRTGPVLMQTMAQRGRVSVRSMLERCWISLGGPACTGNASELLDASAYFELLDVLEDEGLPIDRDTLDLRLEELYAEPDAEADTHLQVLTIHAAKGLQFDNVIIPGLGRSTAGDERKLLHWFELADENKIVMSPMRNQAEKEQGKSSGDLIKFISNVEKQRQRYEDGRLLYVAATRAIRNLYLFGAIKPNAKGEVKPHGQSLLASLWPAVAAEQEPLIIRAVEALDQAVDTAAEELTGKTTLPASYYRLSPQWQAPDVPLSVQQTRAMYTDTRDAIEFSWAGEDARHTGNLVHRLLQWVGENGRVQWENKGGMAAHENWCRQRLACEGITADLADGVIQRVSLAMDKCLASTQGRWILQDHEDAHCEYAIIAVMDNKPPKKMVLDRTFVEDGVRWIIDYKTSSHTGGALEAFLENERRRYAEQLEAYARALALTETLPIRTALYFPLLDRLVLVDPN